MVRIACFVAVVGLMPNEAALRRIDAVAIRHLQSTILAFGLCDRLTLVMGNREHIRLGRPAVLDESGACQAAGLLPTGAVDRLNPLPETDGRHSPTGHSSMLHWLAIMALRSIRKMRCLESTEKYLHGEVKGQPAIGRIFRR